MVGGITTSWDPGKGMIHAGVVVLHMYFVISFSFSFLLFWGYVIKSLVLYVCAAKVQCLPMFLFVSMCVAGFVGKTILKRQMFTTAPWMGKGISTGVLCIHLNISHQRTSWSSRRR